MASLAAGGISPPPATVTGMADYIQVTTATETREQAVTLARGAVHNRLVAGVQIVGPVISVYRHLGEFGESEEWMIIFKTADDQYTGLEIYLSDNHPWDNPEIAVIPIIDGPRSYLDWIRSATRGESDQ